MKRESYHLVQYPVLKGRLRSMIDILKSLFSFQLQLILLTKCIQIKDDEILCSKHVIGN